MTNARRFASFPGAMLATAAALALASRGAAAADVGAAQLAFIQRVADSFGAAQPTAPTHAYIGGLPPSDALPPSGAPPLPTDATVIGSIVREGLGFTIYADIPRALDATEVALDAPFAAAGYRKLTDSGRTGFTTGSASATTTYCSTAGTMVVRAYPARESATTTHVDVTVSTDKRFQFACLEPADMRRMIMPPGHDIPSLHGTPGIVIESVTSEENGTWSASQSSRAYAATSWGRVVSTLPIDAVDAALTMQLTAGGWTSTGKATTLGTARAHRFTTPASGDYGPGDGVLTLVPAGPGSYDAFVRLLKPLTAAASGG